MRRLAATTRMVGQASRLSIRGDRQSSPSPDLFPVATGLRAGQLEHRQGRRRLPVGKGRRKPLSILGEGAGGEEMEIASLAFQRARNKIVTKCFPAIPHTQMMITMYEIISLTSKISGPKWSSQGVNSKSNLKRQVGLRGNHERGA